VKYGKTNAQKEKPAGGSGLHVMREERVAYTAERREWLRGEEGVITESFSTFMGRA
jgi:hypothetical protein